VSILQLAVNIACTSVGILIGYILGVRRARRLDRTDPAGAPHQRNGESLLKGAIGVALVIASVFIVVNSSQASAQSRATAADLVEQARIQAECNDEFFRVLQERSAITADDNALNRADAAALNDFVRDVFFSGRPPSDVTTTEAARKYQATIDMNNERRVQNDQERTKNPYPEPRCGN
jgi:hypothetical protein